MSSDKFTEDIMIHIKNMYFSYEQSSYILKNLNFSIQDGSYISILGENGSGKSTFIKLLLNLLIPTSGHIENTFTRTAYVPQRFESLNTQFPITIEEILTCYQKARHIPGKKIIDDSLALVKMQDYKKSLVGTLSGGQCQKIFIARALMGNPDLLILDEPSNGVDIKSQNEIYQLIKNLNQEKKITVICVEHNLKAAIKNSTLLYHIAQGVGHICNPQDYIREYLIENTGVENYVSI